ncbi:DEAD/DEAH box helicase (plasmid) [Alicyclobacillus curvatus]|nr:DEAD/DEAH box helicase [Alicyclobacillus curvatus]
MIALRDYQKEAIQKVKQARQRGIARSLLSLPTGAGKTVVFSSLARELNVRTLILAHRDELLTQAAEKLGYVWPDVDIGFVKAKQNDFTKQVVVASVQTLASPKRLEQVATQHFGLCIIDEAHHATAPTYKRIIERLGFTDDSPDRLLVGVTATGNRGDGTPLGDVFEEVVYHLSMLTLMRAGYLSDIKAYRVKTDIDLKGVHSRGGDFIESELAQVVNTTARNNLIVDKYIEFSAGRKAIAFCVNVLHAQDLANTFLERMIPAKALSGNTPPDERKQAIDDFASGKLQVLTNCNLLTEGFDQPDVGCVLMARPTKSQALYIQCVGRGTRKAPGKENCIVVDFTENRHDVCMLPSLFGIEQDKMEFGKSVIETVEEEEAEKRRVANIQERIRQVKTEEFDLVGKSRFAWFEVGDEWRLLVRPRVYAVLVPVNDLYAVRLRDEGHNMSSLHDAPLPLGFAMGIAEDYARENGDNLARRDARWRKDKATQKQIDLLEKLGVAIPDDLSKGEASLLIDKRLAEQQHRPYRETSRVGAS